MSGHQCQGHFRHDPGSSLLVLDVVLVEDVLLLLLLLLLADLLERQLRGLRDVADDLPTFLVTGRTPSAVARLRSSSLA
jgi:hypothetical protein